jgi:hypothetical protein
MAVRRSQDASKLSFPLQVVITIIGVVLAVYASQASVRSDIRDILTRLELGRDTAKAQSSAQEEKINTLKVSIDATAVSMKGSIDAISRRQEMQQIQIGELKDAITKLSTARK